MKPEFNTCFNSPAWRLPALLVALLFLSACSTYSNTRTYGYQPHTAAHAHYSQPGYGYGNYQPGWWVSTYYQPYWGYRPSAYWPTNSYYYQSVWNSPYYDPWYQSYSSYYRNAWVYSPRSRYGAGYGYYSPYYGGAYGYNNYYGGYYGGSHSYRPPGQQAPFQQTPPASRIPPEQRGGDGPVAGYNGNVARGLDRRERRSVEVVNEYQDMSRSVSVAPGASDQQGMVVTNKSERKTRPSRLEPGVISSNNSPIGLPQQPVQTSRTVQTRVPATPSGAEVNRSKPSRWSVGRTDQSPIVVSPNSPLAAQPPPQASGQSRRSMTVNESAPNRYSQNRFPAQSSSQSGAPQQAIQQSMQQRSQQSPASQSAPADYQSSGSNEGSSRSAERRERYSDQDSERERE
jgi:hypothetical protein